MAQASSRLAANTNADAGTLFSIMIMMRSPGRMPSSATAAVTALTEDAKSA